MEKRRRWQKHNVPGLLILFSVIFTFYSICDDGFAENSNFNAFHLAIYLWPNEPVRCVCARRWWEWWWWWRWCCCCYCVLCGARAQAKIATKLFSTYRIRIATVFSYFYLFIFFPLCSGCLCVCVFFPLSAYSGFLFLSAFRFSWTKRPNSFLLFSLYFPFFSARAQFLMSILNILFGSTQTENGNGWRLRICKDAYYYFDAKEKHSWTFVRYSLLSLKLDFPRNFLFSSLVRSFVMLIRSRLFLYNGQKPK